MWHLWLAEGLAEGQHVTAHRVLLDGREIAAGQTIGVARLHTVGPCRGRELVIEVEGKGAQLTLVRAHRTGTAEPRLPDERASTTRPDA